MKSLIFLAALLPLATSHAAEEKISLAPTSVLGKRGTAVFREVVWNADSEWFHGPAPVCRSAVRRMDFSKFHEVAKEYGMEPKWNEETENHYGSKEEGAFYYFRERDENGFRIAAANPVTRKFKFQISNYFNFARDEHQKPIVKPLPGKDESMKIAREWMTRLGIDENELYRKGDGPDGFDVLFRIDYVGAFAHGTTVEKQYRYGITLNIAQQIGGLPALWHGVGGSITCEIGDGGEFCSMHGILRGWEKIGDYAVLDRDEVTTALKERYFWLNGTFESDKIEIIDVKLAAYHAREFDEQKNFPLVYTLLCKVHGGIFDGEKVELNLPALKQHRNRYGPPPPLAAEVPFTPGEGKPVAEPLAR